jgi:hypothetical protein
MGIAKTKAKTNYHSCGEQGHWHKKCPQNKNKKFKTKVNVVETLNGVKDNVAYAFMIEAVMFEEHQFVHVNDGKEITQENPHTFVGFQVVGDNCLSQEECDGVVCFTQEKSNNNS